MFISQLVSISGESVPVSKMPVPKHEHDTYCPDSHKRHTLFCGTRLLQTHDPTGKIVKALVVRTGYATAKGELVRSILFPKPVHMKFYTDSMRFVVVSFGLGKSCLLFHRKWNIMSVNIRKARFTQWAWIPNVINEKQFGWLWFRHMQALFWKCCKTFCLCDHANFATC